jgi:hypothetical protein
MPPASRSYIIPSGLLSSNAIKQQLKECFDEELCTKQWEIV